MARNIRLFHCHSTRALIGLHGDNYAVSGTSPVSIVLFHFLGLSPIWRFLGFCRLFLQTFDLAMRFAMTPNV